jgi:geranylgeranyl reductase family protein
MSSQREFDIIIVGGGPAGTACALALAGKGLRVVIIDKSKFPRDKICGDAIPGPAFKLMDQMNPAWGKKMRAFSDKDEVKFSKGFSPNGKTFTVGWQTFSYNSKRENFDNFLFDIVQEETKTTVINEHRVDRVFYNESGVACTLENGDTVYAKLIIGCDGARSIVSRQLAGYDIKEEAPFLAMRTYYKNVTGLEKNTNEFHFFKEIMPGYFWIFPLDNGWANVGFGFLRPYHSKKSINMRKTLEEIIANHPRIAPRFAGAEVMDKAKGFALPISTKKRSLSGNNYMLCGDAASLINPIGGHGIDTAMWSGHYAAQQAIECFERNDFTSETTRAYSKLIQRKFKKGFNRSYRAAKFTMNSPSLMNAIFNNGKLIKKLIDI